MLYFVLASVSLARLLVARETKIRFESNGFTSNKPHQLFCVCSRECEYYCNMV